MSDNTPPGLVTVDMLLELHGGLVALKEKQTEINRRIGNLEKALEPEPETLGSQVWGYFLQAIFWGAGITFIVVIGGLFGVEVRW